MSFLNPVNEPVLRFSSTDAGAPQINYNARTAGDVKAVLKACLVTGYGATASAGWAVVNEVGDVCEFVSPSAAMSDYRLKITDSTATNTTWEYCYQDTLTNPTYNTPIKALMFANKTHANNGWQMLVTERGLVFIELVQHSVVNKLSARITYWGAVKSAVPSVTGKNICFFNLGHNAGISYPNYLYSPNIYTHVQLDGYAAAQMSAAINYSASQGFTLGMSNVDLVSSIYLTPNTQATVIGELPVMLSKIINSASDIYGISEFALGGRNVLSVCAGYAATPDNQAYIYSRTFLIRTDYWEY